MKRRAPIPIVGLLAIAGCSSARVTRALRQRWGGGRPRADPTGGAGAERGGGPNAGGSGRLGPGAAGLLRGTEPGTERRVGRNVTGNLANMPSECGNLTLVMATPCSPQVIAGVAQQGLWQTTNGGETWEALGSGAGSAVITNRPSSIVHDPEHAGAFWTSGIYNGAGVYKSSDVGVTFDQLGDVGHNDLVSVDFDDPERKTLLAGGHEQKQTRTLERRWPDWTNVGRELPAARTSRDTDRVDAESTSSAPAVGATEPCGVSAHDRWRSDVEPGERLACAGSAALGLGRRDLLAAQ